MGKQKMLQLMLCLFGSLMLAGILTVMADITLAWMDNAMAIGAFFLILAALTGLFCFLFRKKAKNALKAVVLLLAAMVIGAGALFLCWRSFSADAVFAGVDQGKQQLYGGRRVMLIVPHQDDEINVLGGVMEEYVHYGSELYPVFITNGDAQGLAEDRFREALAVMDYIGVPRENVTFLGYGDDWAAGGPHIYNAAPGVVVTSFHGKTATYAASSHGVYREGREYTSDHLLEDLEDVILERRADVIICVDYDDHVDHKATSLAFEKVMGNILKNQPDYRPRVLKGYAYNTAWFAEADFYETNILSTQNVFTEPYNQTPAVYRWEERLRLPVWDGALSRSIISSGVYHTLALHKSQRAANHAGGVVNGDKVLWYRDTTSLCLGAEVTVSAGDGKLLQDFMLIDSFDLADKTRQPYDSTWIPGDDAKSAQIRFAQPVDIKTIFLYDNPSPDDNVLNARLAFPDGSVVNTGALDVGGAATMVAVEKNAVTGFTLTLTETEGENAGLTEIEAFDHMPGHGLRYIKVTDGEENFLYDYWLPGSGEETLQVYTCGIGAEENMTLTWEGEGCAATLSGGEIKVSCPRGKSMTLTVSVDGTDISDTVRLHNPGMGKRLHYGLGQLLEARVLQKYWEDCHIETATYRILVAMRDLLLG